MDFCKVLVTAGTMVVLEIIRFCNPPPGRVERSEKADPPRGRVFSVENPRKTNESIPLEGSSEARGGRLPINRSLLCPSTAAKPLGRESNRRLVDGSP